MEQKQEVLNTNTSVKSFCSQLIIPAARPLINILLKIQRMKELKQHPQLFSDQLMSPDRELQFRPSQHGVSISECACVCVCEKV